MTGKLMFVPDTHVVVPKEFLNGQLYSLLTDIQNGIDSPATCQIANSEICKIDKIMAAPQLTTPPVLRWVGLELKVFKATLCIVHQRPDGSFVAAGPEVYEDNLWSIDEARRAAEKALGLPIVEGV